MDKAETSPTRKRNIMPWVIVSGMLLLIAGTALYVLWPQLQPHATVRIGDGVFLSHVANTQAEREKGLSKTDKLRENQAILFVYESNGKWPIWMKDMNYPVDIVWLDSYKKVVYIVKNAPPESYPEAFEPTQEARFVLELPAGTVGKKSITIGTQAAFDENNLEGLKL